MNEAVSLSQLHLLGSGTDEWITAFQDLQKRHVTLSGSSLDRQVQNMADRERDAVLHPLTGAHSTASATAQPTLTLVSWQVLKVPAAARFTVG